MQVSNLTKGTNGAKVANQYNIEVNGVDYFQSYLLQLYAYKLTTATLMIVSIHTPSVSTASIATSLTF